MFLCSPQVSVKREQGISHAINVRCKTWGCPHCQMINRFKVIRHATEGRPDKLLTLTVSSTQYPDPDEAADVLKRGWRALQKRIAREKNGLKIPFLAVFERHKKGHPHMHLLLRAPYLPWEDLRRMWEEITGSIHIHIKYIPPTDSAARYVAKYIGKDLSPFANCKRWWRSHDYAPEVDEDEAEEVALRGWNRLDGNVHAFARFLKALGANVTVESADRITWSDPPSGQVPFLAVSQGSQYWYGHTRSPPPLRGKGDPP